MAAKKQFQVGAILVTKWRTAYEELLKRSRNEIAMLRNENAALKLEVWDLEWEVADRGNRI